MGRRRARGIRGGARDIPYIRPILDARPRRRSLLGCAPGVGLGVTPTPHANTRGRIDVLPESAAGRAAACPADSLPSDAGRVRAAGALAAAAPTRGGVGAAALPRAAARARIAGAARPTGAAGARPAYARTGATRIAGAACACPGATRTASATLAPASGVTAAAATLALATTFAPTAAGGVTAAALAAARPPATAGSSVTAATLASSERSAVAIGRQFDEGANQNGKQNGYRSDEAPRPKVS
jgi:hypothetical protein